ncbi:MAG TPA: sulfotransferase domain-containing protein [Vicinamibacterales bacterium]|nr:sulfotransferase domain-containing protein [Vicinamibacterales bacterium]
MLRRTIRRIAYGRPVIVVSGLPRSGTSMMMKMLEAGGIPVWLDGVREADEQNPKGYYELERVKELDKRVDKAWVREGRGRAVKVISSLLEHLPATNNYQVVFMHRDLQEVLASQTKMLVDRGEERGAADETLHKHYEKHLRRVKEFVSNEPWFSSIDVHYTDVLTDVHKVSEHLNRFLGRKLHLPRMREVVDGQLYRNRRTPG